MRKLGRENLYQFLRTKSIGSRILDNFEQVTDNLEPRMVYFYKDGRYRLARSVFKPAVRIARNSTATSKKEREQLSDLEEHFDHGPRYSEIWAVLNPNALLKDVFYKWNDGCRTNLKRNGEGPNERCGLSEIPEWAEPIEDFEASLGNAARLVVLSEAIVELRKSANAMAHTEWMPVGRRNMDYLSRVGEICKDRRRTPLYVSSPRMDYGVSSRDILERLDFSTLTKAMDAAEDELIKFSIDSDLLVKAVYVAVEAEARRATTSYDYRH